MKILWVKAGGLVPPDTGGKIRSYNILRELAREHSVTFFSFYAAHPSDSHPTLKNFFERVVCLPLSLPVPKSRAEIVDYGIRLLSSQPYLITKYCRSQVNDELRALLQHETYDVIVCDFLSPAGIIPWESRTPKVVFTHNVEAVILRRHYEVAANPLWKAISWWGGRKTAAAGKRYLPPCRPGLHGSYNDPDYFSTFLHPPKI